METEYCDHTIEVDLSGLKSQTDQKNAMDDGFMSTGSLSTF